MKKGGHAVFDTVWFLFWAIGLEIGISTDIFALVKIFLTFP